MIRTLTCWALALFFLLAGIAHFTQTAAFAAIVPPLLPFKSAIVWITGAMEIGFAILLLCPHLRPRLGWIIAAFLLAVLPANIYMALAGLPLGALDSPLALWTRVALQFPLIALVLWATRVPSRA
jgi:uncharacterized membrane protein